MVRASTLGAGVLAGFGALVGTGWFGLQMEPAPFPAYPAPSAQGETVVLPPDLPSPVARYFRAIAADHLPRMESAVVTGRGRLAISGVNFPSRFRFTHDAGKSYRHYIECTWFRIPVLKVNESYVDGRARLELPFGTVANEPKVDAGANLALWGESIWLPSIWVTDARVRWEPIDDTTSRLIVPDAQGADTFTVKFAQETGLIEWMEALRYRAATDETKIPWRFVPLGWQTLGGMRLPSPGAVRWMDEAAPWLILNVEDVVYNADVSHYVRSSGI